jgi:hypothetical protein
MRSQTCTLAAGPGLRAPAGAGKFGCNPEPKLRSLPDLSHHNKAHERWIHEYPLPVFRGLAVLVKASLKPGILGWAVAETIT